MLTGAASSAGERKRQGLHHEWYGQATAEEEVTGGIEYLVELRDNNEAEGGHPED